MKHPMQKHEAVVGWLWLIVHIFGLPVLLDLMAGGLLPQMGVELSEAWLNVIYYGISYAFLTIALFSFMRSSFRDMTKNFSDTLSAVLICYLGYYLVALLFSLLVSMAVPDFENPNQSAVEAELRLNPNTMLAVGVFLAPIVEETLFRGVVFGTIRKKNRVAAYVVSALLFSVYHVWQYFFGGFSWSLVISMLQYVPASLALCYCYERGKSVWAPVFMHMLVNFVSISVSINL